jgi:mannose-6-phosphate isomerase
MTAAFAATQSHFMHTLVPMWAGPGWNADMALPYEAVDAQHQPLAPQRYRAMACARQLYVFSSLIGEYPGAEERAGLLFRSLQRHFHDAEHGGWFYSVDAKGEPLDTRKDLYTHAFIVFACAHYWGKVREPFVESVLDAGLTVVLEQFANRDGLYDSSLARDWSGLADGPLQNPLMHLAEAFLATLEVRDDAQVHTALLALTNAMHKHFVEPVNNLMLEKPLGAVDNWFEPGHQFEWYYLVVASPMLRDSPLRRSLELAFGFAEQHGVKDGAVLAMLEPDGRVRDATQRIWAQAEYLRALTLRDDAAQRLPEQLAVLRERFLHARGWHECRDGDGEVSRHDMPSTTPYHLATCYQGLAAVLTAQ